MRIKDASLTPAATDVAISPKGGIRQNRAKRLHKKRLDVILCERGLAKSRQEAKSLIMSGLIFVDGVREDKAGASFNATDSLNIECRGQRLKYVSRGGLKLEKAVRTFGLNFDGLCCMDVGASTGGFTDCMLQNGAKKVYAVDVGFGQLDWKLRNDERVVLMEKTNIRYLGGESLGEKMDFISADVSFISLRLVLPVVKDLLKDSGCAVCLIKPQFEASRGEVGKRGVVKDPGIHKRVCIMVADSASQLGFGILGFTYSPIKGPNGNKEYLVYLSIGSRKKDRLIGLEEYIKKTVDEAFWVLG